MKRITVMAARRRARTGRGWDAAPARTRAWTPGVTSGATPGATPARTPTGDAPPASGRGGSDPSRRAAPPVDPAERAREICLRQLAVRPRTRRELAAALRRHGVAAEIAAEVLERYSDVGIIDDRAFARAWVTSRHHGRGLARRALAGELRRKGVDAEAVGAALDELDHETEARTARILVERKLRGDRGGSPEAMFRRLVGMLARKGYPAGLAISVVRDALAVRRNEGDGVGHLDEATPGEAFDPDQLEVELLEAELIESEADNLDHLP